MTLETKEEYKKYKMGLHDAMVQKQSVPYATKVKMTEARIEAFIEEAHKRGLNCHVSVGGLDSIVLGQKIRSMGYSADEVPFVSASSLEDKSIQAVHREMGCLCVKPLNQRYKYCRKRDSPSYQRG